MKCEVRKGFRNPNQRLFCLQIIWHALIPNFHRVEIFSIEIRL